MAIDFSKTKGAGRMKVIQKKSTEQSNGLVAINIPLDQIDENPENAMIFNMEGIEGLAEGIKKDGFLGAITVFKKDDGRFEISSGHRRYRAMRLLEEKTIPAIVKPYPKNDNERMLQLISSNIRNRDLKPMDWARAMNRYCEIMKATGAKGTMRDLAAEYFQMASSNVGRYLALLNLIKPLQQLADDPGYSFSAISNAASLSEDEQEELYKRIREESADGEEGSDTHSLSRTRIQQLISDIKTGTDSRGKEKNDKVSEDTGNSRTEKADISDRPSETVNKDNKGVTSQKRDNIELCINEIERITAAKVDIKHKDEILTKVKRLEKAIRELKKRYK
ncbi:MAG: ParB/RepB/Spo0J family partition protein [Lachnospiraceae bacterium]|nr:ParB/RepB/Spo0J family partition protein [Lachnospiraceae bacterium]